MAGWIAGVLQLTVLSLYAVATTQRRVCVDRRQNTARSTAAGKKHPRSLKHQQTGRCRQARPQLRQSRTLTSGTRPVTATASRGRQGLVYAGLVAKLTMNIHVLHG